MTALSTKPDRHDTAEAFHPSQPGFVVLIGLRWLIHLELTFPLLIAGMTTIGVPVTA